APAGAGSVTGVPWPNLGGGRGSVKPAERSIGHAARQAKPPRQTMTVTVAASSPNSAASQGAQVSRSVTEGLLRGGAHRTAAAIRAPTRRWPSPAAVDAGCAASPQRLSEASGAVPL